MENQTDKTFVCRNAHKDAIRFILDNIEVGRSNTIKVVINEKWN